MRNKLLLTPHYMHESGSLLRLAVRCDCLDSTDSADESPGVGHFAAFRAGILNFWMADHLNTIARGGGLSFPTWCYSGKSRIMIPHQSVAHCSKPRERNVRTIRRERVTSRPLDEDTQYGICQSARSSNPKYKF